MNNTNNETDFPEPRKVFKESFEVKVQKGYVIKCLDFRIYGYPLGFSIDQTDHIMELVNE